MSNPHARQPKRGGFQPGVSGNPGGRIRSKGLAEKVRAGTADGLEIVDCVLGIMRDKGASNSIRLAAATFLADRGYGKPTEHVEIESNTTSRSIAVVTTFSSALSASETAEMERILAKARSELPVPARAVIEAELEPPAEFEHDEEPRTETPRPAIALVTNEEST